MKCDKCNEPSPGPRCPRCIRTHGYPRLLNQQLLEVDALTPQQRRIINRAVEGRGVQGPRPHLVIQDEVDWDAPYEVDENLFTEEKDR